MNAGDVVMVRTFNRAMPAVDDRDGWTWERVRVVDPFYPPAFGPSFVGEYLTGRHAGRGPMALQVQHVRGMDVER